MSEMLCYKCLEEIEWAVENEKEKFIPYCSNEECDVEDGTYKDKANIFQ